MPLVPLPHRTRNIWLAIFGVVALALLVSAFLHVEKTVSGVCLLEPCRSWTLKEVRQGTYESKALDLATGQILHYRLYQFDRPAFLELDLSQTALSSLDGHAVEAGQIVARMKSSSLDIELAERSTDLQMARGRLQTMLGGSKPEAIEHAQLAMARAQAELDAYHPQYERQRQLHLDGIVSDLVWEETVARQNLLELDVHLAEAELQVLASDARPEKIAEAEMSITALEEELRAVESMLSAQEIQTPVAGWLRPGSDGETLLSVNKQDTMIVHILVPQSFTRCTTEGQTLKVYIPGAGNSASSGTVIRVDKRASVTAAGSFITVYGTLDNRDGLFEEGMQGRARLYCGKSSLLDRIWRDMLRVLRQELWPA